MKMIAKKPSIPKKEKPKTLLKPKKATSKKTVTPAESATMKKELLEAMLLEVPNAGWTEKALLQGAEKLKIEPIMVWALFPDKEIDALKTWSRFLDQKMAEKLGAMDLPTMPIRMRIFWGVKMRLSLITPYKAAAAKVLRFLLNPKHALLATTLVYETVHQIWKTAGDTSVDYNFYTKRFLLSGVYVSTFLYWLKDTSPEHHATGKFLEARIENVLMLQKAKNIKAFIPNLFSPLKTVYQMFWPSKKD